MKKYKLVNLDCANCASKIENNLKKKHFVKNISINFASCSMLIDTSDIGKVKEEIKKIDPNVNLLLYDSQNQNLNIKNEIIILLILSIFMISGIIFEYFIKFKNLHLIKILLFLIIYIAAGYKVIWKAGINFIKGRIFDENFLMSIATLCAIFINAIPEAAGVMLFYKIGDFFQRLALNKSRKSIKSLLQIRPEFANLKINNEIKKVLPEEVNVGDIIIVKPGEKTPLDGMVLSGDTYVDTSNLTGESTPRRIKKNESILAGMINKTHIITVRVDKIYNETSIAKIMDLVENAVTHKSKIENFITSFAKIYTPIILIISIMVAFIPTLVFHETSLSTWIYRALVILVISCPCALVISIPLGYFGGIGSASKNGILIKGSNFIDGIAEAKIFAFDKTGTLTKGVFKVQNIIKANSFKEKEILKYAAIAEYHSNHPIANSIKEAYNHKIDINSIKNHEEISGYGIKTKINDTIVIVGNDKLLHKENIPHEICHIPGTIVHIAINGKYAGYISISDELKIDSMEFIGSLKKLGVQKSIMLTGDNEDISKDIAQKLKIDEYFSNLLPENKLNKIESIINMNKNSKVAFVGDGINDIPVIARADIGIAMGKTASDAAIETADIVIMNDSLIKILDLIKIAKKTKHIIIQNIVLALGVKIAFILLGILGTATMWEAVFGDMGVSLLALFNAMRIFRKNDSKIRI